MSSSRLVPMAVVLAGVLGCNTPGGDGDQMPADTGLFLPTDGKRLKTRWYQAPDGQRSFAGWYDSMLKARCSFRTAMDGESRCLPDGLGVGPFFADPDCATPIAVDSYGACQKFDYALRSDSSNACQTRWRVYRLGETIEASELYAGSQCGLLAKGDHEVLRALGEELPVTMFVRRKPKMETETTKLPLRLTIDETDDGATVDGGWRLTDADEPCGIWTLDDGRFHCVPGVRTAEASYADASCTESLVSYRPSCEPAPRFARRPVDTCPPTPATFHQIGPRVPSVFRVRSNDNMCVVATIPVGYEYRRLGEPVAADDHPAFDEVLSGTGRLRRRTFKAPGGRSSGSNWFDHAKQAFCSPLRTDGKYRCVSGAISSGLWFFADEQCTEALWETASGACPPQTVTATLGIDGCAEQTVYAIGEPFSGDRFYRLVTRSENGIEIECVPDSLTRNRTFNRLTALPPDEFVEFKVVEPK